MQGRDIDKVLENLVNENFVFIKAKGIGDMIHIVSKGYSLKIRNCVRFNKNLNTDFESTHKN